MTDMSARFSLPLLQPGQAQKEMFHNEALVLIDAALHGVAQAMGDNVPPASPAAGQCWIVGDAPVDAWAGMAHRLAAWTAGGWRFVAPVAGMTIWLMDAGLWALHDGTGWRPGILPASALHVAGRQVVGAQQSAIADPDGGASIDGQARSAIRDILVALRSHGLIATV